MAAVLVICKNEVCPKGLQQRPQDPQVMECVQEFASAWHFRCPQCRGHRVVSKDQVGGSFGVGRRDDGTGPGTGKGPARYRPGMVFTSR